MIDDTKMHTLASASTMQKPISEEFDYSSGPTIVSSLIGMPAHVYIDIYMFVSVIVILHR